MKRWSMRLAVKTGAWTPTPAEWNAAAEILEKCEPSELARIMRSRIEEDRKRSLVGRLLLRYACSVHLSSPYDKVRLERTANNKPFCPDLKKGDVNISHHGDWVVLASDPERSLGVDVMKFEEPRRGRDAFFKSMRRQFTEKEWVIIDTSLEQFYKHWALKESYIKAIGIGLGFNLQRASFSIDGDGSHAQLELDGALDDTWDFHLAMLDPVHVVAVALGPQQPAEPSANSPFKVLTVTELLTLLMSSEEL